MYTPSSTKFVCLVSALGKHGRFPAVQMFLNCIVESGEVAYPYTGCILHSQCDDYVAPADATVFLLPPLHQATEGCLAMFSVASQANWSG